MTRKRLLLLSCAAGYGGAERSIECLAPGIAQRYESVFAVENELHRRRLESGSARHHYDVVRFPGGRHALALLESVRRTLLLIRRRKIDAILTNTNKGAMIMALGHYFIPPSIPILVYMRDFQWSHAPWIIRRLASRARFCAPSAAIEELWPSRYGPRPPRIEIVPDPGFEPASPASDARSSRFLIMGAISRWKGTDVLVKALAMARNHHPELVLDILGDSPDKEYRSEIQDFIDRNQLSDAVHFRGHVEDVSSCCFDSLGIVNASVPAYGGPETFGRTIVEAWAHSRPVISTRCGGPGYIVDHERTGLLVDPNDPEGLADAMCRIAEDAALRERLSTEGRQEYLRNYTVDAVASQLCASLESAKAALGA